MRLLARSTRTLKPILSACSSSVVVMTVNWAWPCCMASMRRLVAPTTRRLTSRSGSSPILRSPTPELLYALNARRGDQIVRQRNFETHNHRGVRAADPGARHRRAGACHHLQFSSKEGHERFGRALDVDDVDVKAVPFEKAYVFGDPENRR